jgi:predicted nucleic-acid-binding protein
MLISACSSTSRMTIGVTQPARIFLSSEIRNIGIINRSKPAKRNARLDRIDQLLSAEGFNLDKKGADVAISSFSSQAKMIKNFDEIIVIEPTKAVKNGLGALPATLSMKIIVQLCEENNVDLIFSLAFYDTDTQSVFWATSIPINNNLGIKVNVPLQEANLNTVVNNGWRI